MVDPKFNEAWFNAEHAVLGRRLHPFCLHDALILSLLESPFMLDPQAGVGYDLKDLQLAVVVCSTPSEVFFNARLIPSWFEKLRRILWARRCSKMDLEEQCQRFVTYIDDFYSPPDTWSTDGDLENAIRAPWVLANATFLLHNTTLPEDRIWKGPIGQMMWYAAALSEQLGSKIQLLSDEERVALKALGKV